GRTRRRRVDAAGSGTLVLVGLGVRVCRSRSWAFGQRQSALQPVLSVADRGVRAGARAGLHFGSATSLLIGSLGRTSHSGGLAMAGQALVLARHGGAGRGAGGAALENSVSCCPRHRRRFLLRAQYERAAGGSAVQR